MRISLTPETAQRIRDAIGDGVDLAPESVPAVLARLAVEAPPIYSEVLAQISGSQIRLDSESELHNRRRRNMLRRLLFSWGEYETGVGDRVFAKRRIAAAVPLSAAGLTLVVLAAALVFGHRPAPSTGPRSAAPDMPAQEPVARPSGGVLSRGQQAAAIAESPLSLPQADDPAPVRMSTAGFAAGSSGSPIVVRTETDPARDFGFSARPGTAVPVIYNRTAGPAGDRPAAAPDVPSSPAESGAEAVESTRLLVPGTRLSGRLVTGILIVPGGPPAPVVVEAGDPPGIWLGQAVLAPGGRVQITLQLAGQDRAHAVRALALDPARLVPGLTGRTSMEPPAAGPAMATAALGAAVDYAQTAARQGNVGALDGWDPFSGGGPAPAWTYVAARLAQALDTRGLTGTRMPATEVPAGAQMVILVMGGS
ncbi:MAG TPA: hypothetical protein VK881_02970 [bacterium]|nr:hypothetical protein [bacterium]